MLDSHVFHELQVDCGIIYPFSTSGLTQQVSIAFSAFTLAMTSSTFMLLQHSEFRSYDPVKQVRTRGINNPPLVETIIGTIFYLFITVPRIFAGALFLAITPQLAFPMYFIQLCISAFAN